MDDNLKFPSAVPLIVKSLTQLSRLDLVSLAASRSSFNAWKCTPSWGILCTDENVIGAYFGRPQANSETPA